MNNIFVGGYLLFQSISVIFVTRTQINVGNINIYKPLTTGNLPMIVLVWLMCQEKGNMLMFRVMGGYNNIGWA